MRWDMVQSPIGPLSVAVADGAVCAVRFGPSPDGVAVLGSESATGGPPAGSGPATGDDAVLAAAVAQLRAYFAGDLTDFTVPYAIRRGSDFERAVWAAIAAIPYGETRTYGALATGLGDPGAARAVGTACNRNPVPVIVPCHRVVGAGGKLVGFGGGLPRKVGLLELEARVAVQRTWS